MIQAVCFDMDGVLFDTERRSAQVMVSATELQGFTMSEALWKSTLGQNLESCKRILREHYGENMDPDRFVRDWCRLMRERAEREGMPEKPGAREALQTLRAAGMRLALVTSNEPDVAAVYLRISGFGALFDRIVTGEMTARGKPAPDIYLRAAELLGVPPGRCAGVEDSVNGVKALRAAGMRSVMVPDTVPYSPELAPYVDLLLSDLTELVPALLEKEKEG